MDYVSICLYVIVGIFYLDLDPSLVLWVIGAWCLVGAFLWSCQACLMLRVRVEVPFRHPKQLVSVFRRFLPLKLKNRYYELTFTSCVVQSKWRCPLVDLVGGKRISSQHLVCVWKKKTKDTPIRSIHHHNILYPFTVPNFPPIYL